MKNGSDDSAGGATPPRRRARSAFRIALILFAAFGFLRMAVSFCEYTPWIPKVDFNARYNEVLCLRAGYDPYDVFTGKVSIPCVVSMADLPSLSVVPLMQRLPSYRDFGKEGQKEMAIHAYPPWSYAWLVPWTLVPRDAAWMFHLLCEMLSFAVLFAVPAKFMSKSGASPTLVLAFVALAANFGKVFPMTFMCGNYSLFVAAGAVGMAHFLDRGKPVAAGLCFAVMMLKPQIGTIFAIPLLMGRRFLTIGVAVAACVAGTILSSVLCGTSPVDLIRHSNAAGPVFFQGTALVPWKLFPWSKTTQFPLVPVCAAFGSAVCVAVSWRLRRLESWFFRLAPVAVCSLFWMVARTYDHAILLLPLAAALLALRPVSRIPRKLRALLWLLLPAMFLRNLNPVVGEKALFLCREVSRLFGADLAPVFDLRTAVASWCWAVQPLLFVPLAAVLSECLRMGMDDPGRTASGSQTAVVPDPGFC